MPNKRLEKKKSNVHEMGAKETGDVKASTRSATAEAKDTLERGKKNRTK